MIRELPWRSIRELCQEQCLTVIEQVCEELSLIRPLRLAIEIGSWHGCSTLVLAQYFPKIICVDLWGDLLDGESQPDTMGRADSFNTFLTNMQTHDLYNKTVFPIVASSEVLNIFDPLEADVIFIDACHYLEEVRLDIKNSKKHVAKDGLYIFHDYHHEPVKQAVDELVATGEFKVYAQGGWSIILKRD
jgi:hypothetical protein